jgi:hypothetical protein
MLTLTLIRLLRDAFGLIAGVGWALTVVAILGDIDAFRFETDWSFFGESQRIVAVLGGISAIASFAWYCVMQKERMMARRGLTRRCS